MYAIIAGVGAAVVAGVVAVVKIFHHPKVVAPTASASPVAPLPPPARPTANIAATINQDVSDNGDGGLVIQTDSRSPAQQTASSPPIFPGSPAAALGAANAPRNVVVGPAQDDNLSFDPNTGLNKGNDDLSFDQVDVSDES